VQIPDYVLRAPTTDVTTLDSGLRVASETVQGSETATVGVWIDAGSRYETAHNNGVAHFLEHLAFKGTQKRTQQQLEVEIENMGGHLNAYTSREQTVYFAKVFKNDVGRAVEILSDILLHSKLDEGAIERERDVILREMSEVNKKQEELVLDHLHATAFQGTGLGRTILGPEENVRSLQRSDLVNYIQQHYTAPRMVIAGAGAINHDELCGLAGEHFGNLPTVPKGGVDVPMEPAYFTGSDYWCVLCDCISVPSYTVHAFSLTVSFLYYYDLSLLLFLFHSVKFNTEDTAYIALAYEAASWTSEYAFPLMLMQVMLGAYDRTEGLGRNHASRLCQDVAEHELAHSVSTFNTCYKDTGLFGVYMVCPHDKVDDLMWTVMNNLVRMVHMPSDEEVERAKLNLKAIMLMGLDGHSNVAEDIGRQMLTYGRRMTPAEIFSRIDAVTTSDIRATAAKFINDQDHALAAVGGIHELPDYNWVRRHSYWLRY
jgi:mitochondrial-processing peptidase subunit beta